METEHIEELIVENFELQSRYLKRTVKIDAYQTDHEPATCSLMFVNDGQDLVAMDFPGILRRISLRPVIIVGIHCGADRKNEYGMSAGADFHGWGAKAQLYESFVIKELLPFIKSRFADVTFTDILFAGFSLGGLSAFDIGWNHPELFSVCGIFSGSLWWRTVDKGDKDYNPWEHRMMHSHVRHSDKRDGMKFFFECGELDETEDRNKNGVIDSIDDTIDLMRLLVRKGYREGKDFVYLQLPDGKHDVPSWARAWPHFLEWALGKRKA